MIKSGLVIAQTNAESERSLLINARVVTSERSALGEVTITGLCTVKEAVRFYDPVNAQPENIAITKELKRSEKLEDERKREEAEQKMKEAKRIQKAKEETAKSRQSLQDSEDTLIQVEEVVKADLKAADELMSEMQHQNYMMPFQQQLSTNKLLMWPQ